MNDSSPPPLPDKSRRTSDAPAVWSISLSFFVWLWVAFIGLIGFVFLRERVGNDKVLWFVGATCLMLLPVLLISIALALIVLVQRRAGRILAVISLVLSALFFVVCAVRATFKPSHSALKADKTYIALGDKALKTTASELHVDVKEKEAFGLVADIGMAEGAITVVVFKNGDTSMYTSKGGSRTGGKVSEEIRKAGEKALAAASAEIARMKRTSDFDVILPGHARVYVITSTGIFFDDADSTHMNRNGPAYALISAIDPVITGFRHLEPGYKDSQ